jgi:hypothetical protein
VAAVVREAGGLARGDGDVDDAFVLVKEPPLAPAAVVEVDRVELSLVAAGEVAVGRRIRSG